MDKEIQDIIKKSLPAHVSEVLQERLKFADHAEDKINLLIAERDSFSRGNNQRKVEIEALKKECDTLRIERERVEKLELREAIISLKEEHAISHTQDAARFVGLVFNNHRIHKNIHHTEIVPVSMQGAQGMGSYIEDRSRTETKTEETDMT